MDKNTLRQQIRQYKKAQSPQSRTEQSGLLMQQLAAHPQFAGARTILLYHALPDEVDTRTFIREWSGRKQILLPVVTGNELILKTYLNEEMLHDGSFGIMEPEGEIFTDMSKIDLAVIPGMAFDKEGNRLGRGKGFYDRLLHQLKDYSIYKIGICFDYQFLDHIPTEPHDIPVDEVITLHNTTVSGK